MQTVRAKGDLFVFASVCCWCVYSSNAFDTVRAFHRRRTNAGHILAHDLQKKTNTRILGRLSAEKKDDDDDFFSPSALAFEQVTGIVGVSIFLATVWGFAEGPLTLQQFDLDFFLALDRTLTTVAEGDFEISELPRLSPAEQLVGALFGPPNGY